MADTLEITIAGNLRHDVQIARDRGEEIARTQLGITQRHIRNGKLVERMVCLTIEIHGAAEAHTFAACNTKGSRVVVRGHLEERQSRVIQQLPRADGLGTIAVLVEVPSWVVVVEVILADGATVGEQPPLDGAQQQAARAAAPPAADRRRGPASAPMEQPPPRPWQWQNKR
jgi:hypothetical protein